MTLHRHLIHLILPLVFSFVKEGELCSLIAYDFYYFVNSLRKAYCLIRHCELASVKASLGYPLVRHLVDSSHHQTDFVLECFAHSEIFQLTSHHHRQSSVQDFSFLSFSLDFSCSDGRLNSVSFPYYQGILLMQSFEGNIDSHLVI